LLLQAEVRIQVLNRLTSALEVVELVEMLADKKLQLAVDRRLVAEALNRLTLILREEMPVAVVLLAHILAQLQLVRVILPSFLLEVVLLPLDQAL